MDGTQVTDILDWIAETGYEGIEITNSMIGELYDFPEKFADELAKRNLKLAAFAYATTGFTDPNRWDEDMAGARRDGLAAIRKNRTYLHAIGY